MSIPLQSVIERIIVYHGGQDEPTNGSRPPSPVHHCPYSVIPGCPGFAGSQRSSGWSWRRFIAIAELELF